MRDGTPTLRPPARRAALRTFETSFRVRSYELDSFRHMNHAVALNYFEEARWLALEEGGFPIADLGPGGEGVYLVRIEVEYRGEARLGDHLSVRTRTEEIGRTSITLRQELLHAGGGETVAEARVVLVWVDPDGRPTRVPDSVREALAEGQEA